MFRLFIPLSLALLFAIASFTPLLAEQTEQVMDEPGAIYFTPPEGWRIAEADQLPPNVKIMVVGKGDHTFAPSINLTVEPFKGTLKQYLKLVKAINDSKGSTWQDLGSIKTQAGNANLSQVDNRTEWGETRMMHAILAKNNHIYILTAAALKEEFPRFYKEFFNSLRSLHMNKNVYEMISNPKKRQDVEKAVANLKISWKAYVSENGLQKASDSTLFKSEEFQNLFWKPFQEKLTKEHKDMSPAWRDQLLQQVQNELYGNRSP